jgi:hypothetical protein
MMHLNKAAVTTVSDMLASWRPSLRLAAFSTALPKPFQADSENDSEWWAAGAPWDERERATKHVKESTWFEAGHDTRGTATV